MSSQPVSSFPVGEPANALVVQAIIALLLRISDQTRRPAPEVSTFDRDEETQVVKLT